jgi:hypothetical protein
MDKANFSPELKKHLRALKLLTHVGYAPRADSSRSAKAAAI